MTVNRFDAFDDDERRALKIAVAYALREGLATDFAASEATNATLVQVAGELGVEVRP